MLRHPVQLTSLEEDFKKLGLLNEQEETMTQSGGGTPAPQLRPGPSGKPAPNKAGSRNVGAQSDGDTDDGKDGNDTVPGHEGEPGGSGPTKPSLPTTPGAQKEDIRGMSNADKRRGGSKAVSEKEEDPEEDDGENDDDEEEDENEEVELEGSNQVMEAVQRLRGAKRRLKTESKELNPTKHLDKVASLIEDVNGIMESIDTSRRGDAVRAFANSAIISEMLAKGFAHFADAYEDEEFAGAAEAFAAMSEDAANVAHTLEEGEEVDADALQEEFRSQMDALMEGLDLYSDVVEADSELEEEEADEVEEEAESAEEESEGSQDEARFQTALIKKKGKQRTGLRATTGARAALNMSADDSEDEEVEEEVEEEPEHQRATGGIVSQRIESYFRQGKMGPSGKKMVNREKKMKMG
jgi:hypothetical protein